MTEETEKRPRWVVVLLVILPLWLVVSGGVAVWHLLHREQEKERMEQERFAQSVSESALADDLRKLVEIIGERNAATEGAAKNLTRAAAMIEGSLGPANTGFSVSRTQGPADWPLLHVRITGTNPESPALWVVCSYDSRPGSPGVEANATGVAATLAAAQALATEKPATSVHFAFLPHANDPDSPVLETADKLVKLAGSPAAILCVEAMGAGNQLWLSSRDTAAMPLAKVSGLGSVRGAEVVCLGEDVDLASVFFQMGLPAVRVSTRPQVIAREADATPPAAATLASSTGCLVELIRRCAGLP
ncbi:MAG: M28 family peptidase [Verrucomicrobiaceae bacterium]|nr:MAG: M28 family peptidase [Verrucomicrobiaceae bacterium]